MTAADFKKQEKGKELISLGRQDFKIAYEPAKINFEFPKIKAKVAEIKDEFTNYEVTPDNIKGAKATRARLNQLSKDLNSRKIAIVKVIDQPVNELKAQIKELTGDIGQATDHIDNQIKAFEKNARDEREKTLNAQLQKLCDQAGVNSEDIEFNSKWLNKTASYATFEKEVNNQIQVLLKEQKQYAENVKVITNKAHKLGLPYQHWVGLLDSADLSAIILEMDNYADEVKKAAERDNKPQKGGQSNNVVNHHGKAIDKTTGEVVNDDYVKAYLFTRTSKIELSGTRYQFTQLMAYLSDMGFGINIEKRA